jgi:hypothetical protein
MYGMSVFHNFPPETAIADAFKSVGNTYMSVIIYICAFFGISAAAFANLLIQPRILMKFA